MKIVRVGGWVLLGVLALVIALAPLGPVPGVFIGGTPTPAPAKWQDTSSVNEILLRVPGTLPWVVTLWVVEVDNELYVVGSKSSTWVSMIGQGGPVEMRLGDNTYALGATRLAQGWEPVYHAYLDKYRADYPDLVSEFPSIEEGDATGAIFRLSRDPEVL